MKSYKKILYFILFFEGTRMLVGGVSIIYLIQFKNISVSTIALLRGLQFFIFFLTDIPTSYLSDKKSKKLSIVLSMFFASAWLITEALAHSTTWIIIAEIFNTFSLALAGGATVALLIQYYQKETGETTTNGVLRKETLFSRIGIAAALVLSSFAPMKELTLLWLFTGACLGVIAVLAACFLPKDIFAESTSRLTEKMRDDLHYFFSKKFSSLLPFVINLSLLLALFVNVINYNQIILKQLFPALNTVFFQNLFFVVIIGAQIVASLRFSLPRLLTGALLALDFFFMLIFKNQGFVVLPLWVLAYFLITNLRISLSTLLHDRARDDLRSTIDSSTSTLRLFESTVISLLIGETYTSLGTVYMIGGAVIVALLLGLIVQTFLMKTGRLKMA